MSHRPIQLDQVSLVYPHKICYEDFNAKIHYGDRIAITGQNGLGKSTLLKMIQTLKRHDVVLGYVPQIIEDNPHLSGAQRFQKALTSALSQNPNLLLLDEPTNHLDQKNHAALIRLLKRFDGTLIVVSHDLKLLETMNHFWHIEHGKIHCFSGNYQDYCAAKARERAHIKKQLTELKIEKKQNHEKLMRDQTREKKRRLQGEKKYHHETIALRSAQGSGENTTNKNRKQLKDEKQHLIEKLSKLALPKIIQPTFSLQSDKARDKVLLTIEDGAIGYDNQFILQKLYLSVSGCDRIGIIGANGSGKTSLMKAILGDLSITKRGYWTVPLRDDIGYLDQHYQTLDASKTVFDSMQALVSSWTTLQIKRHLGDFLFLKPEELSLEIQHLSGGEKARLSLSHIAAKTPKLLILDEITNNLDLQTKAHVTQVLSAYPGAMLVISHDQDFLDAIGVTSYYEIENGKKA